jgi:D-alanyl-D-alanine carboxypeptidase (penicillin-binding protein 5/6)
MKKLLILGLLFISSTIPTIKDNGNDALTDNLPVELSSAKSAILMDVDSNKIIYEYNIHEKRAPASMTKIMTMNLVLDAINNNEFSMNDYLVTSEHASSMGGSQIYLAPNEKMKVEDLFKSMVIASANDAAVVLAEKVSGTEKNFVKKMNFYASKIGCKNTLYQNATGLPEENHYTTCYDMAIVACDLLRKYEDIVIPFSSMYESYVRCDTDNPFWLVNTNKMLKLDNGIDGLKTGWTNEAGYCITTTMKKNGMRLVAVVMGAETPTLRNQDVLKLLEYGFNKYEVVLLKDKGEEILCESDLLLTPNKYKIITSEKITFIKYKNQVYDKVDYEVILYRDKIRNLEYKNIGLIKTYIDGKLINETSLDLKEVHQKSNFFDVFVNIFSSLF